MLQIYSSKTLPPLLPLNILITKMTEQKLCQKIIEHPGVEGMYTHTHTQGSPSSTLGSTQYHSNLKSFFWLKMDPCETQIVTGHLLINTSPMSFNGDIKVYQVNLKNIIYWHCNKMFIKRTANTVQINFRTTSINVMLIAWIWTAIYHFCSYSKEIPSWWRKMEDVNHILEQCIIAKDVEKKSRTNITEKEKFGFLYYKPTDDCKYIHPLSHWWTNTLKSTNQAFLSILCYILRSIV